MPLRRCTLPRQSRRRRQVFLEPSSIEAARERKAVLLEEIGHIDRNLGTKNLQQFGHLLQGRPFMGPFDGEYRAWRAVAIAAKNRRVEELRWLNEWMKRTNVAVTAVLDASSLMDVREISPSSLLVALYQVMRGVRRRIGWEQFEKGEQEILTAVDDYLSANPDVIREVIMKNS